MNGEGRNQFIEHVLSVGTGSNELSDAELRQFIELMDEERQRLMERLSAEENTRRVDDATRLQAVNKLLEVANGRLNEREFVRQFDSGIRNAPPARPWFSAQR